MLIAAFDASGSESDQVALVTAGFVSTERDWGAFVEDWENRLKRDGLDHFHMKKFAACKGPFEGWRNDERRRRRLLGDLIGIILANTYSKFGSMIQNESFRGELPSDLRSHFDLTAYVYTSRHCAAQVVGWRDREFPGSSVEFIFESGDRGKGLLVERFQRDGLPTPVFRPKQYAPVQAADILAYETLKVFKDGSYNSSDWRWPLKELDKHPGEVQFATDEALEYFETMASSRSLIKV